MKFIRISINEFKALLNRVCESYYGHKYDFEDSAAIIQWLEIHDLKGIVNFLGVIDATPKKIKLMPIHEKYFNNTELVKSIYVKDRLINLIIE